MTILKLLSHTINFLSVHQMIKCFCVYLWMIYLPPSPPHHQFGCSLPSLPPQTSHSFHLSYYSFSSSSLCRLPPNPSFISSEYVIMSSMFPKCSYRPPTTVVDLSKLIDIFGLLWLPMAFLMSGMFKLDCIQLSSRPLLFALTSAPDFVHTLRLAGDNCISVGPSKGVCSTV